MFKDFQNFIFKEMIKIRQFLLVEIEEFGIFKIFY